MNVLPSCLRGLLVCGMLAGLCGCTASDTSHTDVDVIPTPPPSIVNGQDPSPEQKDRMLAAKEALFTRLSSKLMEGITAGGPATAISVCQKEAPKIAKEVSTEFGLQIGRAGVRQRNPQNTAPQWAKALTSAQTATPTFAMLSNGHAAALLPIKLQPQCLMCHGPQEQMAPAILEQIARHYPDDEATGFQDGELRGWFWVELP